MTLAAVERTAAQEPEDESESRELLRAREAVLELLATTLDSVLMMVTDSHRARRLDEIAAACERIGFLGQAARRLGE